MRKKCFALLLALLLACSCLTGCASKQAQAFYDLAEEMVANEDILIDLVAPYHGANLLVNGYFCRSSQTADLVFTLEGTGNSDGVWTELRIDGNQMWLNVKQLAERTLAFALPSLRQADIEDLQSDQTADWVSYTWQGDFWSGIPDWSTLLGKVWDGCKSSLNSYISGEEDSYTLSLSGNSLKKAEQALLNGLIDRSEEFSDGFCSWTAEDSELIDATQRDAQTLFDDLWLTWSDLLDVVESGEDAPNTLSLQFSKSDESYQLTWTVDDGDEWALTVTPIEPQTPETPQDTMDFAAYADATYYLVDFSGTYISDVLDGVELDDELLAIFDDGTDDSETALQPMETGTIAAYSDLASIQFVPDGGQARTVPILANYQSNSLSSVDDNGGLITDLTLSGTGWYQFVYSQASDGKSSSVFLSDEIRSYYDAFINLSGYLLVQDLTEQVSSDQGTLAQGFSYRTDNYSQTNVELMILLPRQGNESYTVLQFELDLSEMSQTDKDALAHLFDYLGLELTLDLDA